jgi:phage tail-like protein
MSQSPSNRLFSLMPQILRRRDTESGLALSKLLSVVDQELDSLEADIGSLYDSWFIETCPDALVPELAKAVGVDLDAVMPALPSHRRLVANALRYRREKGTLGALAEAVRDATGWQVAVTEEFEHLAMTQSLQHAQHTAHGGADLSQGVAGLSAGRTVDLRSTDGTGLGGNLRSISVAVSRLSHVPVLHGEMAAVGPGRFTAHPFGVDTPMFERPLPRLYDALSPTGGFAPALLTEVLQSELHDARRVALERKNPTEKQTRLWGPGRSVCVWLNGEPVSAGQAQPNDLSGWARPGPDILGFIGRRAQVPQAERPALRLKVVDSHERNLRLDRTPRDLDDAAQLLQRAIRKGAKNDRFKGCLVRCVHGRLLVLPEGREERCGIAFAATENDEETVIALGLNGRGAREVHLLLSAELSPNTIRRGPGQLKLVLMDSPLQSIRVSVVDSSVDALARTLEAGLRQRGGWACLAVGEQILVVPPEDRLGEVFWLEADPSDSETVSSMGLLPRVAIDPERGRVCLPIGHRGPVFLDWAMGLDSNIGASPLPRTLVGPNESDWCARVGRHHPSDGSEPGCYASLETAVNAWERQDRNGYIRMGDNGMYGEHRGSLSITLGERQLRIESEANGHPCLARSIHIHGDGGGLDLLGLFCSGEVRLSGKVHLSLSHCSLLKGLHSDAHDELHVILRDCVLGPILLPAQHCVLDMDTCVVNAQDGVAIGGVSGADSCAPATWAQRCTVLGRVRVNEFHLASNCLFTQKVWVQNKHLGIMDHCAVVAGSETPPRLECMEISNESNTSLAGQRRVGVLIHDTFGQPNYARPLATADEQLHAGASNGSEIGVYNSLFSNRRMHLLRSNLHEFLPVGWAAHIHIHN